MRDCDALTHVDLCDQSQIQAMEKFDDGLSNFLTGCPRLQRVLVSRWDRRVDRCSDVVLREIPSHATDVFCQLHAIERCDGVSERLCVLLSGVASRPEHLRDTANPCYDDGEERGYEIRACVCRGRGAIVVLSHSRHAGTSYRRMCAFCGRTRTCGGRCECRRGCDAARLGVYSEHDFLLD